MPVDPFMTVAPNGPSNESKASEAAELVPALALLLPAKSAFAEPVRTLVP
jgi:hypothetical protein